jgi:hypothetical protein
MPDSDDSDIYIGDQQIINQEEQSTEIGKNEILQNCALSQTKMNCKLIEISSRRGHPNFHFEINGKIYFYGIAGIRANFKIVLRCYKKVSGSKCHNYSAILPSDFLKQIIQNSPKILKSEYPKCLDKSDSRVFDINNYDINSFEIGNGHNCSGTELHGYLSHTKPVKCKLVKIANRLGHPSFHFEIDGKFYFYGLKGIRADNKFELICTKAYSNGICNNSTTILPLEFLKEIIQDLPKISRYPKILDKSDPRVYEIQNYDINSFDIFKSHKCSGLEIEEYIKISKPILKREKVKCRLVKVAPGKRGHPSFHFEINGKMYFYGLKVIRSDYKINLNCTQKNCVTKCNSMANIISSDALKKIIQTPPQNSKNRKNFGILDKSDPRVYDISIYDINEFESCRNHNHPGMELDEYFKNIFPIENKKLKSRQDSGCIVKIESCL